MKYLIVGLGNPGKEYENTRHNIGFRVCDFLASQSGEMFKSDRLAEVCTIKHKGRFLVMIKPSTFMNLSGKAVQYWMQKEKISIENVLVIVDDLALPFGSLRLRGNGSDAGHNGLKSIQELLQSANYPRLRFGIGNDFPKGHQADYVLSPFKKDEEALLAERIEKSAEIIKAFCTIGLGMTMTQYNNK